MLEAEQIGPGLLYAALERRHSAGRSVARAASEMARVCTVYWYVGRQIVQLRLCWSAFAHPKVPRA